MILSIAFHLQPSPSRNANSINMFQVAQCCVQFSRANMLFPLLVWLQVPRYIKHRCPEVAQVLLSCIGSVRCNAVCVLRQVNAGPASSPAASHGLPGVLWSEYARDVVRHRLSVLGSVVLPDTGLHPESAGQMLNRVSLFEHYCLLQVLPLLLQLNS